MAEKSSEREKAKNGLYEKSRLIKAAFSSHTYHMTIDGLIKQNPSGIIARAYTFAEKAHHGQKRKSGEPYFKHPLATAETLALWHMDDATIAAGLLHDTVEDTSTPLGIIQKEFGEEVAFLVNGVTKLGHFKYRGEEKDSKNQAENLRKMVLALSEDLRVVFIKLADRLHNMNTLAALPPAKQKRVALETDEIYAPLAYRLGMYNLSGELQDLAFPFLYPKEYEWLIKNTKEQYEARLAYLEKIKPEVLRVLREHNISPLEVEVRAKRYSSLYKKLLRRNMDMARIYDFVALRVILQTIPECYAALGIIHETWPPVPRRIKDYVAMPKPNGYRSLHTTVIGPDEKTIEVQIRTKEMHDEDEYGVAAHWLYKEKKGISTSGKKLAEELTWVQQLKTWQEHFSGNTTDAAEMLQAMKVDFFQHRIFAVTPQGDVVDLPAESTPVDFAYHIHSEIGNTCVGAKVNGSLVPLDHKLKSGDVVQILTQKGKKPSEDWLRFAKTTIARDHIRLVLRNKNKLAKATKGPTHCELKLVVENRVGLIKDISAAIARNHVGILSFHSDNPKGSRYSFDKVEIQTTEKAKVEKLLMKLKAIPGVKETSYRLI
jgi:guanosine-3',5'-bis(diphosphate) 3'-pyrophosphohydrolase